MVRWRGVIDVVMSGLNILKGNNVDFLLDADKELGKEFKSQGYIVRSVENLKQLTLFRDLVKSLAQDSVTGLVEDPAKALNEFHKHISAADLNPARLKIIHGMNEQEWTRPAFFELARTWLERLVGNELAMQLRLNLSIQMPGDSSSLLPIHSDAWGGDSPFEVVVWLPLVDCYRTKSMFLLPPEPTTRLHQQFGDLAGKSSEDIYQAVKDDLIWMSIPYGSFLLFNQNLPHGNRVNEEDETRWSVNCRFKGVFTPYSQKKLGEFFEPITLRPASDLGLKYEYPVIRSDEG